MTLTYIAVSIAVVVLGFAIKTLLLMGTARAKRMARPFDSQATFLENLENAGVSSETAQFLWSFFRSFSFVSYPIVVDETPHDIVALEERDLLDLLEKSLMTQFKKSVEIPDEFTHRNIEDLALFLDPQIRSA